MPQTSQLSIEEERKIRKKVNWITWYHTKIAKRVIVAKGDEYFNELIEQSEVRPIWVMLRKLDNVDGREVIDKAKEYNKEIIEVNDHLPPLEKDDLVLIKIKDSWIFAKIK